MSFNILLRRMTSEKIKLNKTCTTIQSVTGTLKDGTSIIDPVFLIQGNLATFRDCNYVEVDAFKRNYFVNDIKTVRNNLFELHCHVDVLSTYKVGIRANRAIIKKSQNNFNTLLNDGSFKVYQNPVVLTKDFPSGFSTFEYVLAIAGY